MTTQRPVFLDILKLRFPVMAMISICHRLSGIVLFLMLPLVLYLLSASLASPQSFAALKVWVHHPGIAFLLWILLTATAFHLLAGFRHLLMDCGLGESLKSARLTSYIVLVATFACAVLLGVWLWA